MEGFFDDATILLLEKDHELPWWQGVKALGAWKLALGVAIGLVHGSQISSGAGCWKPWRHGVRVPGSESVR